MLNVKKPFAEIYAILQANENRKVSSIMDQLLPLMESQQRDKNHYTDEHGLWIFCYYHKQWELTQQVEYGSKANTATGLNSMCKVGTNQWTKQQREFKQAKANLLELVASGELAVDEIDSKIKELEEEKDRIVPLIDHHHDEALQMNASE